MARKVRDAGLETRNARRRLKVQNKPYWKAMDQGLHLGYRKHSKGGTWVARRLNEQGRYRETGLSTADDYQDADGVVTFDFRQAQEAARQWYHAEIRKERGLDPDTKGTYTVADALRNYMAHYAIEGKAVKETQQRIDALIIPALGNIELDRLTTKKITDWHHGLAASPARLRTSKKAEKQKTRKLDSTDQDAVRRRRASKSGKPRHVVLTAEGKAFFTTMTTGKESDALIFTHKDGSSWGRSHQSKPLADACKPAKISPAVSFHVLRHTHGSLLAMQGVPMPVIAQQLGHADTRMTEKHYAHLSPSYVADTIRQHFPALGLQDDDNVVPFEPKKSETAG